MNIKLNLAKRLGLKDLFFLYGLMKERQESAHTIITRALKLYLLDERQDKILNEKGDGSL